LGDGLGHPQGQEAQPSPVLIASARPLKKEVSFFSRASFCC
jgi:hypothetical protein